MNCKNLTYLVNTQDQIYTNSIPFQNQNTLDLQEVFIFLITNFFAKEYSYIIFCVSHNSFEQLNMQQFNMQKFGDNNYAKTTVRNQISAQCEKFPSTLQPFTPLFARKGKVSFGQQIKIDDQYLQQYDSQKSNNPVISKVFQSQLTNINHGFDSKITQQASPKTTNSERTGNWSYLSKKISLNEQLVSGISQRYMQKIKKLQKTNKLYKQEISKSVEKANQLHNQNKKLKKQMEFFQQKLDKLQHQKCILQHKLKEFQTVKRQLQLLKFSKNQEIFINTNRNENLKKKLENRQTKYTDLLDKMNETCIKIENQKYKMQFQYTNLKNIYQQQKKQFQALLKEQEKQYIHQKQIYQRQINKLQAKLAQKIYRECALENGHRELKKSIELQKNNDQKMKQEIALLNYQLNNLKSSLFLTQNSLILSKQEMKSLSIENEQIKKFIVKMGEKDQLINILRNKIIELQDIIEFYQQKIKSQDETIQNIQQGKKDLEQQQKELNQIILEQKKLIDKLISQLDELQRNTDDIEISLLQKCQKIEQQKQQYQKINRQMIQNEEQLKNQLEKLQNHLVHEQEKGIVLQDYSKTLKNKNSELQQALQKVNIQKMYLSQNLAKLTNDSQIYGHKANTLQSKLQQLIKRQMLKESVFCQQIESLAKKQMQKDQLIESLKEELQEYRLKIKRMDEQKCQLYNDYINKQKDLQELQYQIFQIRNQKYKFQHKLQMVESQCSENHLKINQYYQELEELRVYTEELQTHINQLDNIIVWDFQEGKGESNNYQERKIKLKIFAQILRQKTGEIGILNAQKLQQALQITQKSKKIEEHTTAISAFTQKIEQFLRQKEDLSKMIQDIETSNKVLAAKLETLKQKETALNNNIKLKQDENEVLSSQIKVLLGKQKIWQNIIKEKQATIQQLIQKQANQKQKSNNFKQTIERLTLEKGRLQDDSNRKIKQSSKHIETLKKNLQEKIKGITQIDLQKKQQRSLLNNEINLLKTEMKDFGTFYDSQKFNFIKRNILLMDLGTNLGKLERASAIRSNLISPLKEILRKMEQFDNNSSRLFAKYDKFEVKKEN